MREGRDKEIGYWDAASQNRFSSFAIIFGSYVRKCDMAAKSEKGPLGTCLVVCTFWFLFSTRKPDAT